jgi:Holliday junction resolvasome RuvABC ATP-dependent DNA helicase subunit
VSANAARFAHRFHRVGRDESSNTQIVDETKTLFTSSNKPQPVLWTEIDKKSVSEIAREREGSSRRFSNGILTNLREMCSYAGETMIGQAAAANRLKILRRGWTGANARKKRALD